MATKVSASQNDSALTSIFEVDVRNVGAARAAGFAYARSSIFSAQTLDESRIWYATTDADSRVDSDWLIRQTKPGADIVLGVVRVHDWRHTPAAEVKRYLADYRSKWRKDGTGHGHVHGANSGFRADFYWEVGGFAGERSGDDVALVRRFDRDGRRIDWETQLSVETSALPIGKAPRGFARYLRSVSGPGTSHDRSSGAGSRRASSISRRPAPVARAPGGGTPMG